jgi:hypothetical protein
MHLKKPDRKSPPRKIGMHIFTPAWPLRANLIPESWCGLAIYDKAGCFGQTGSALVCANGGHNLMGPSHWIGFIMIDLRIYVRETSWQTMGLLSARNDLTVDCSRHELQAGSVAQTQNLPGIDIVAAFVHGCWCGC